MKISQFLPKGVGVLFVEKPYLKRNNHPLPVKKRNPEGTALGTTVCTGWAHDEAAELFSLTSQIGTETPNSSK